MAFEVTKKDNVTWHHYGLIHLGIKNGDNTFSEMRAQGRLYAYGFRKVALDTIEKNKNSQRAKGALEDAL